MLVAGTLPEGGRRGERAGNSLERREECPKLRFRRRGCSYRYECKEECKEKKDCKTTYQYKCKEYKKQVKIRWGHGICMFVLSDIFSLSISGMQECLAKPVSGQKWEAAGQEEPPASALLAGQKQY